ncbi:MAG: Na-translocating system protein MpsC family protein [Thermoguttaceae bacterium]
MRTKGEIEAAICERVSRFEQEYMGRGPNDIHTHLLGDLLVVRLQGVLTAAEQHLAKSLPADKGRDLLKQVRTHLIETARPVLEAMVHEVTGVKVLTLHHDISTVTGEEVVLLTLAESPDFRDAKKKQ